MLFKQERLVNERDKWLYVSLLCAKKAVPNPKKLLLRLSEIYTDFDYPASMQSFIYYMPPSGNYDPTQFTIDENREKLIQKLDEYLSNVEDSLSK